MTIITETFVTMLLEWMEGTVDIYSVEYTVFVAYIVMNYHAG